MTTVLELLGEKLYSPIDDKLYNTRDVTLGKYILIYFCQAKDSGQWTLDRIKQLSNFYTKNTSLNFEIIYFYSNLGDSTFPDFVKKMPWKVVPLENRREELIDQANVQVVWSILQLYNTEGSLLVYDCYDYLMEDPEGKFFPWKQKKLLEILAKGSLHHPVRGEISSEFLEKKYFGVFFDDGNHEYYVNYLHQAYKYLNEAGKHIEILHVPCMCSNDSRVFKNDLPWLQVKDKKMGQFLENYFRISDELYVPQLSLIDANGKVVSHRGLDFLLCDPEGLNFPWFDEDIILPFYFAGEATLKKGNFSFAFITGEEQTRKLRESAAILKEVGISTYYAYESTELANSVRKHLDKMTSGHDWDSSFMINSNRSKYQPILQD